MKQRIPAIFAVTALLVTWFTASSAVAQSDNVSEWLPEVATKTLSATETQEAASYWSEERMRGALERDVEIEEANGIIDLGGSIAKGLQENGVSKLIDGVQSSPILDVVRRAKSETPVSNVGKVFFSQGDKDYVCSGNVVTSSNGSTVSTAGHCVNSGDNEYFTNFIFVPGYENGAAPFGKWPAESLNATAQWVNGADLNYDTAFVKVTKLGGKTIQQHVGSSGVAFNQARGLEYKAFGYPQAPPFDGQSLKSCQSKATPDPYGESTQGITCGMTGGSSGGPWFIGPNPKGQQNSINSYGYRTDPTTMYGPYWGTVIQAVYTKVSRS